MAGIGKGVGFEDLLPVIANKLGGEGLIKELCNGFQLLMDKDKGVITLESLRRNSALMGLQDLKEDELVSMMREGDLDGDGALTQMEFCVLMFRLSPQLMEESWFWLEEALHHELNNNDNDNSSASI
ncbi:EF-Hand 1, calcium-binding site [Sesbania bispinosa]|nr:EF-Hand 1, calcium-binding site [Sesbania bispinosa]